MSQLKFLYLLIPLFGILLILVVYFYVNWRKKYLHDFFEKQKEENDSTTNQKYTNELKSLSLLKAKEKNEKIIDDVTTMVYEINKLKKQNLTHSKEGQEKINKYQIFASNKLYKKIKKNQANIQNISQSFFDTVDGILADIKIIRKEITNYKNGLLKLKEEIKIIQDEYPNSNRIINGEFEKIANKLKELDDLVATKQIENALMEFSNIKNSFYHLLLFANSCQELEKCIFTKIPEYSSKLQQLFVDAQKNTHSNLSYLSFDTQFNELKNNYANLIKLFNIEEWSIAEEECNKMVLKFSNLNHEINREIKAYLFIDQNKNSLYKYKKNISKLYLSLNDELKIAYQIDKVYFSDYMEEMTKLEQYLVDINSKIQEIELDDDNTIISFLSRQFKYKSFYYQVKGFYTLYAQLKYKIELFYLEGESNLLKFERLSLLFRTINSYVKNNNIILSYNETENAEKIREMKQKIINIILLTPEDIQPHIVNEYQKILSLIIEYVSTVGLKIEISKIFKKTIKILASRRSSDPKLNESIVHSENAYLEGNYNQALNNIINTLNKGTN